jgi:alkanesulfonate monooxygenase SsuD/methylene tetrahydromethanopterin reductase-like flavin-dependent oxidoreductase (luciferase family)
MTARLRTNRPLIPLETVEAAQAGAADFAGLGESFMASARAKWFVGTAEAVASDLRSFAARHGVDEVMISPIAGSYENEPQDAAPGRLQTLELLAAELGLS